MVLKDGQAVLIPKELINYIKIHEEHPSFILHYGDLTDSTNLIRILQRLNLMRSII